jgi:hypothetical protein
MKETQQFPTTSENAHKTQVEEHSYVHTCARARVRTYSNEK